ncbi:MAG TPA: hypothetical protein VGL46_17485 [Pseudonocardiaceae bacterium]
MYLPQGLLPGVIPNPMPVLSTFDVFLHRLAAASLIPAPLPAVRRLLP